MKKIYRFLLAGTLSLSTVAGVILSLGNKAVQEVSAAEKVTNSITTDFVWESSASYEDDTWSYDCVNQGLLATLNTYRRAQSSKTTTKTSISTNAFEVHVISANNRIPADAFSKMTKIQVTFTVDFINEGQTKFRYSLFKTDYGQKLYTEDNLTMGTYTRTFAINPATDSTTKYMFKIDAYSFRFNTTNLTFDLYSNVEEYAVSISKGTGINSVFLSTNENATSGSASGTNFEKGSTVYGFVTLKDGYNSNPDWTNVSGNVYRIGSKTNLAKAEDFGTINAPSTISYDISYELDGGSITGTNPTSYDVESESFTLINPTKTGYTFTGWSGTGIAGTSDSVTISKGSTGNRSYTANWTVGQYNITYLDAGSTSVYSGNNIDDLVKTHTYNTITNLVDGVKPGNVFGGWFDNSECTGNAITSIGKTDYTEDFTLYAKWIVKEAVQDAMDKINAIGEVSYPNSGEAINTAREAYNALPIEDQGGVENYSLLTAAETEYENQKMAGVNNAESLINAIGEVEDTLVCKDKIDAARSAYDALSDEQKGLVTPALVAALENKEAEYKALHDQNMANATKALIDAIGTVEYTDACKNKIDSARASYNALENDDQKALVTNYQTLLNAEAAYAKLKADHEAAESVEALVNAIGEVEDTLVCKGKIDAARAAFDGLTDDQKALLADSVENTLEKAEADYKALHDQNMADATKSLIDSIGEVQYTDACKDKINAARESYDALSDEQKDLVTNYETLVQAEQTYSRLTKEHNTRVGLGVGFGVAGGIILLLAIAYVLMMFVFNGWIKKEEKVVRVFKLFGLKKDDKPLLLVFPFRFESRQEDEIFKSKEDALK